VPIPQQVVDQLIVRGVPAGERASLSGLVALGLAIPAIRIERCDGAVVLDSVSQLSVIPNGSEIDRCRHVVLRGCTLSARDRPLRISDSSVLAVRSSFDMLSTTNTGAGIRLTRSELDLVDTTVLARTASFIPLIVVRTDRSDVRISGATTFSSSPAAFPAFHGICTGGASTVTAPPGHGLTALGCVTLVSRWVPSVGLDQPIRGTPLQWQVHGAPGSVHLLFAGLPALSPLPIGIGDLWLLPTDPVEFVAWARADASGAASGAVGRVPMAFPPGLTVALQSAVLTTGSVPTLSLPALAVVR